MFTVRHALGMQTINQVKAIAAAGGIGAICTIWYWSKVPTGKALGVSAHPTIWLYAALAGSIVAGISGNSGNQTITMIVRALALGQISAASARAAVDLAVPRSPRINTPPIWG